VGLSWLVLMAFVRLSTSPIVFPQPLGVAPAFDMIQSWLERPNAVVVQPTPRHLYLLRQLLEPLGTAGNLSTDAYLAALAIEHGAVLYSTDRDFARFPGLRWENPIT
jgi:toxin-antitoxin system PIN domain toxin